MKRTAGILVVLIGAKGVAAAQGAATYLLSPRSRFEVATTRSGLFSFVAHDHVIRARALSGHVVYDAADPSRSRVEILVLTDSLEVLTPPDTAEIRKVTAAMRSDVLDVAQYPQIRFVSRAVEPIPGGVRVHGDLTLVGATREVSVDVRLQPGPDTLRASGSFAVKQSSFGIHPYHGGPGGVVRVADRVTFTFDAVALRAPGP